MKDVLTCVDLINYINFKEFFPLDHQIEHACRNLRPYDLETNHTAEAMPPVDEASWLMSTNSCIVNELAFLAPRVAVRPTLHSQHCRGRRLRCLYPGLTSSVMLICII